MNDNAKYVYCTRSHVHPSLRLKIWKQYPIGDPCRSTDPSDRGLHIGDVPLLQPITFQYTLSIHLQELHHIETPPTQRYAISAWRKRTTEAHHPCQNNAGTVLKQGATLVLAPPGQRRLYRRRHIYFPRAARIPISARTCSGGGQCFSCLSESRFRCWSVCVGRSVLVRLIMSAGRSAW